MNAPQDENADAVTQPRTAVAAITEAAWAQWCPCVVCVLRRRADRAASTPPPGDDAEEHF